MNFDETLVIGVGGSGKVYKGEMENDTTLLWQLRGDMLNLSRV
jgi:hypothetical protein